MADYPLRNEKEKAFAGQEDRSYYRQQRVYLAWRDIMDEGDHDDHQSDDDEKEDLTAIFGVACRSCNESFPSGNRLHSHLKSFNAHVMDAAPKVIDLTA